ncbi:hypothetical protein GCM10009785_12570 [Brooklawnia cerclae]|uniref:hypothetical protein n=1 Tax=Brooklawnia cerclae TaxID=349934 RepID=UPI0031E3188A
MDGSILDDAFAMVADPVRTESLGKQVAEVLGGTGAQVIVVDPDIGSALLGHIAARELGASGAVVSVDLGVLDVSPQVAAGARVALVSRQIPTYPALSAVCHFLEAQGASVVGIVCGEPVASGADLPVTPVVVG